MVGKPIREVITMQSLNVQGAPTIYRCEEGILNQLPDLLENHHFNSGAIIHGEASWKIAKPYIHESPFPVTHHKYQGECSHNEVHRLSADFDAPDVLIGVGGGKILDLTKACGNLLDVPVILIPTLASNCAAWTPLSVFYDNKGNFVEYIMYPKSTFMVLIEPEMLLQSPVEYLRAGIGDTIAKWYEADVMTRKLETKPIPLEISLHAAKLCRDVLLQEGLDAVQAHKNQRIDPSFVRVVETIILAGGMVGGFGDRYGRISGAHSIHNGLTKVEETHAFLHGEKVAYGILVQLSLENHLDEVDALLPFYEKMKLPTTLKELNIHREEAVEMIAEHSTKKGESIHFMGVSEAADVEKAIVSLEKKLNPS